MPQIPTGLSSKKPHPICFHLGANNWKRVMSKIFSACLWFKEKTSNWTNNKSFTIFTSIFCKCAENNHCNTLKDQLSKTFLAACLGWSRCSPWGILLAPQLSPCQLFIAASGVPLW
ncbi:hypothetical protein VP01_4718g1 [Puccinia sorghi]|uniref:Uncharacterized protein n=1 Tax=Puccinia sorghi TaxID=27349 RepID=A0A0L6UMZ1_9BASI|nr:hypothetical protein VP01_4718g1 [Puccinia sorghi]